MTDTTRLPRTLTLETPKKPRMPKPLAKRIDALYEMRAERMAYGKQIREAEKVLRALKDREDETAKELDAEFRKLGGAEKMTGQLATFSRRDKDVFSVSDWDAYYAHIQKTGEFDLLERRPSSKALGLRLDNDDLPNGVTSDKIFAYSLTKATR